MLDRWIIEEIKRRQPEERPRVYIEPPPPPDSPPEEKPKEESERGVIIIELLS